MANNDKTVQLPLVWEKIRILSIAVATLAVPIVIALLGNWYSDSQKQEELGVRYVELAVNILQTAPTEQSDALRNWAIAVIDHFSQVSLPEGAKAELQLRQLHLQLRQLYAEGQNHHIQMQAEQRRMQEELEKELTLKQEQQKLRQQKATEEEL